MRKLGPESAKSYQRREAAGFFARYLSGENILDIGYRGGDPASVPIVEHAIGVDHDYPGYDGIHLPFPNSSQDAVFSSHCYEHIADYRAALRDWYRTVRIGGYIVIVVPHKYLYERKSTTPSLFNSDHKRFYTPASLLREVEESLPPNGFRVRHLADNDAGFEYAVPIGQHAAGCYEIELIIEKISRPPDSDAFELSPARKAYVEQVHRLVIDMTEKILAGRISLAAGREVVRALVYFPTYEIIRSALCGEPAVIDELRLRSVLKLLLTSFDLDVSYYTAMHTDVAAAVASGTLRSAEEHFVEHGYFEGRVFQLDPAFLPLPMENAL